LSIPSHPCMENVDYSTLTVGSCPFTSPPTTFKQTCCICGMTERFIDYNETAGVVEGYVMFGPALHASTVNAESSLSEYRIYLVNGTGRLNNGQPVAVQAVQNHGHRGEQCCTSDLYSVHVTAQLPSDAGDMMFEVVPVTDTNYELWLGKSTGVIVDLVTRAEPEFTTKYNGSLTFNVSTGNAAAFMAMASASGLVRDALVDVMQMPRQMFSVSLSAGSTATAVVASFEVEVAMDMSLDATVAAMEGITETEVQYGLNAQLRNAGLATTYVVDVSADPLVALTTSTTTTMTTTFTVTNTTTPRVGTGAASPGMAAPGLWVLLALSAGSMVFFSEG